jgi:hypothetical protein
MYPTGCLGDLAPRRRPLHKLSCDDLHPIHAIALHYHGCPTIVNRPIVGNVYGMMLACEEFGVVGFALRKDRPGNERHRLGLNCGQYAPFPGAVPEKWTVYKLAQGSGFMGLGLL